MAGLLGSKAVLPLRAVLPLLGTVMLAAPAVRAQDQPAGQQPAGQEQPRPADPASSPPAFEIPASQQVDGPGSFPAQAPAEPRVQIAEVVIEGLDGHPERERLELAVYDAMVRVGRESHQVKAKGSEAVQKQIKSLTAELVPSGDQLNSVIKADICWTSKEWCEYQFITPEIVLERELQWPDEPELIY